MTLLRLAWRIQAHGILNSILGGSTLSWVTPMEWHTDVALIIAVVFLTALLIPDPPGEEQ